MSFRTKPLKKLVELVYKKAHNCFAMGKASRRKRNRATQMSGAGTGTDAPCPPVEPGREPLFFTKTEITDNGVRPGA